MSSLVYILCTGTSLLCSVLLLRSYRSTHVRLLLWSGLCFAGLSVENLLLYLDRFVIHGSDLSLLPLIVALVSRSILLFGLVWSIR